jgi:hypothetical protein
MTKDETSDKFRSIVDLPAEQVESALDFWWGLAERAEIGPGLDLLA